MSEMMLHDDTNPIPDRSSSPKIPPRYALGAQRGTFVGQWTGQPVSQPRPEQWEDEYARTITGYRPSPPRPAICNYLVRRDPIALVSGDLPRFVLLDYRRSPDISPAPYLLGDVRIRLVIAGQTLWVDEHGAVETQYFPWGTEHRIDLRPVWPLTLTITASLATTCGMALSLTIQRSDPNTPVEVLLYYGGLGVADMRGRDRPECLILRPEQEADDRVSLNDGTALFMDEVVPYPVRVRTNAVDAVHVIETDGITQRVAFRWTVAGKTAHLHLVAGKEIPDAATLSPARTEQYIAETRQYYEDLLANLEISTPDPLLDTAFYAAAINPQQGPGRRRRESLAGAAVSPQVAHAGKLRWGRALEDGATELRRLPAG